MRHTQRRMLAVECPVCLTTCRYWPDVNLRASLTVRRCEEGDGMQRVWAPPIAGHLVVAVRGEVISLSLPLPLNLCLKHFERLRSVPPKSKQGIWGGIHGSLLPCSLHVQSLMFCAVNATCNSCELSTGSLPWGLSASLSVVGLWPCLKFSDKPSNSTFRHYFVPSVCT